LKNVINQDIRFTVLKYCVGVG